jgi:hypothetical protein
VAAALIPALMGEYEFVRQNLWDALEQEIQPEECEIYSYSGDTESDPFSEHGILWSFVYFFFNKRLKRILFFSCQGLRSGVAGRAPPPAAAPPASPQPRFVVLQPIRGAPGR